MLGEGVELVRHPKQQVVKLAGKLATEKMTARRAAEAQKFRNELAPVMLLQGPERDAVLRYLVEPKVNPKAAVPLMRASGGRVMALPAGARRAPDGKYYIPDKSRPGKYLQILQ